MSIFIESKVHMISVPKELITATIKAELDLAKTYHFQGIALPEAKKMVESGTHPLS